MGAAVNPKLVPILWGVVGASVVLLIAAFLPWASVEAGPFSQTVSGTTDGRDGVFTLVLALIAGGIAGSAVFLTAKQPALPLAAGIGAVVAGVISALIAIIDIVDIQGNAPSGLADVSVSVGFGLWLTLLAAVVLAAAGGALLVVRRQHS
ncbi:hypothetical protein nbrc107696_29260 [Gordonia spumicola]|uniref:Uncharacterized protein n=1 Tax=Gordonia spumicola TaxID=589161 RepID=A0A7I9VBS1_9ACTN|nr:hypothetical protein nbrc107696_29260 [Gordonia spumicola]